MVESIIAFFKGAASVMASIGINPSYVFAGLAGAFVRTVVQGSKLTWEMVSSSTVGALCAIYITPIIGNWFNFNTADIAINNGLAFAIGMIGISLCEGLFKLAHRWGKDPKLPRSIDAEGFADALNSPHIEPTIEVPPEPPKPKRKYTRRPKNDGCS